MCLLLWLPLCVGAALAVVCVVKHIKDRVEIDKIDKSLEDAVEIPITIEEELKRRK